MKESFVFRRLDMCACACNQNIVRTRIEQPSSGSVVAPHALNMGEIAHGAVARTKMLFGMDRARPETIKERLNICRLCEHATKKMMRMELREYDEKDGSYNPHPVAVYDQLSLTSKCDQCNCVLLKGGYGKLENSKESCRLGKWDKET